MQELFTAVMVLGMALGSFVFVGWIVWLGVRSGRERQQGEIEVRSRMLEKFGTSEEFVQFMQTDAGKMFLETTRARSEKSVRSRVMTSLAWGIVLTLLGASFFFMAWTEGDSDMMIPGSLLLAIGVGLLIVAAVYARFELGSGESGA